MCGATTQQNNLSQEQADYYAQTIQQQSQNYGEDQDLIKAMTAAYEPILAKGPNQEGFNDQELTSLNSQATEGTATNYAQAEKALGEQQDAAGGGNPSLSSGAQTQQSAELAASAANEESGQKQQILQADYAQGYNEWQQAGQGIEAASGQLNPVGYSGAATGAGSAASNTANEIAQENNSWVNATLGVLGSVGGAIVGENPGGIFGSSGG